MARCKRPRRSTRPSFTTAHSTVGKAGLSLGDVEVFGTISKSSGSDQVNADLLAFIKSEKSAVA